MYSKECVETFLKQQGQLFDEPVAETYEEAEEFLEECMKNEDSSGGSIECVIQNMPAGIGEPVFENRNIKQRMAYIPDELFYFMQADTMEMKRFYEGIYPQFDSKLFYKMQEFFPTIDVKRTIRRLSKGMQKQVAFWLAICCKPDLLILDEPVDGLDPVMRRQIWSILMAEVAERKMTVLVSSHNLRELEDTCDHVGIMHHGKIMIERSLSDLQGNISKIQVACQSGVPKLPDDFEVLHMANTGRVYTLIVKGDPKEAEKVLLTENEEKHLLSTGHWQAP